MFVRVALARAPQVLNAFDVTIKKISQLRVDSSSIDPLSTDSNFFNRPIASNSSSVVVSFG